MLSSKPKHLTRCGVRSATWTLFVWRRLPVWRVVRADAGAISRAGARASKPRIDAFYDWQGGPDLDADAAGRCRRTTCCAGF